MDGNNPCLFMLLASRVQGFIRCWRLSKPTLREQASSSHLTTRGQRPGPGVAHYDVYRGKSLRMKSGHPTK